jgi:hypothetical protein
MSSSCTMRRSIFSRAQLAQLRNQEYNCLPCSRGVAIRHESQKCLHASRNADTHPGKAMQLVDHAHDPQRLPALGHLQKVADDVVLGIHLPGSNQGVHSRRQPGAPCCLLSKKKDSVLAVCSLAAGCEAWHSQDGLERGKQRRVSPRARPRELHGPAKGMPGATAVNTVVNPGTWQGER